ncbi:AAA family ATPase [Nonomuraea sp. NPDC049486]|uniref:AAA family ATPase n=1 Tax=Nonomuraea sp. NPDC049486 TaxID=3155773 RepID=UPI00341CEBC5
MNGTARDLIGRDHPAGLLRAEIGRVIDSHGGLVLVTGEAGIGKTTLVSSAAAQARGKGALVAAGSCWEAGSAPGYWPWVQALRALRRAAGPERWAEARQSAGDVLAVLLGEAAAGETAPDGFQVYDAVTDALVVLAQRQPVVVVLDDLHFADPASLRLLAFAAQQTWFERLLLIGTYRDTEVEAADHPLRELLSPLALKATTITLTGLDAAGVAALMTRTVGADPPPDLVSEVHVRTGGNPFFVEQTARLWHSGGSAGAVPPGVRDALLRRLSLLPEPVSRLLPIAAVLGRRFPRQLLAAAARQPTAHVDRLLELAVVAKLVTAEGGGVFAFAHDLVRETLYDSLDDPGALHGAVVDAVDRDPGLAARMLPGHLARHAHLAGDRVDPERVVELQLAAARDAGRRIAAEEHLGHLRRAHQLSRATSPRTRAKAALSLGFELSHVGERETARRLFGEAWAIARELDDRELLTRVALTWLRKFGLSDALPHLREAHAALVGGAAPDDRLALDLVFHLAARARAGGDDDALVFSLWAHHDILKGPDTAGERMRLVEELIGLARRTGDPELEHFASALRWVAMIEQGDPRYLDRFHDYQTLGRRSELPSVDLNTAVDASIVAALGGRLAEAEKLLAEVRDSDARKHPHYIDMLLHHQWSILSLQGRFGEQEEVVRLLRGSGHLCPGLLEGLTALHTGDLDTALRRLAEGEPRNRIAQPLWLRFLAETAAAAHDPDLCARARAALEPHRGRWAVSLMGWDVSGPFDLWLALIDAADERWDEAIAGFTAAHRSADRMRARPWSVLARVHLADALLSRAAPGDLPAARALLEHAGKEATTLGMRHLTARVHDLLPDTTPASPAPPGTDESDGLGRSGDAGEVLDAGWPRAGEVVGAGRSGDVGELLGASLSGDTGVVTGVYRSRGAGEVTGAGRPGDDGEVTGTGRSGGAGEVTGASLSGGAGVVRGAGRSGDTGEVMGAGQSGGAGEDTGAGLSGSAGSVLGGHSSRSARSRAGPSEGSGVGPSVGARPVAGVGPGDAAVGFDGAYGAAGRGPGGGGPRFSREGAVWSLVFAGRAVHVPDAKGLRDLHTLLGSPGTDMPAVRLLDPEGGELVVAARRMGGDDVLDEEAKARYRHHLTLLDEEIDRATELGDDRRAAELDGERAALLEELRRAAGLGGRSRRLGDEAERARKTVTARIRDVLRKLDRAHPELAAHLRATVSTGSTCRYQPDTPITWRL